MKKLTSCQAKKKVIQNKSIFMRLIACKLIGCLMVSEEIFPSGIRFYWHSDNSRVTEKEAPEMLKRNSVLRHFFKPFQERRQRSRSGPAAGPHSAIRGVRPEKGFGKPGFNDIFPCTTRRACRGSGRRGCRFFPSLRFWRTPSPTRR